MDQKTNSKEIVKIAHQALDDKKAENIQIIDISKISVLADYFIIANGTNESHVKALVDSAEEELTKKSYLVKQREGYGLDNWVLLDFGDVIIHIFDRENRSFYDLERVWRDGIAIDITQL